MLTRSRVVNQKDRISGLERPWILAGMAWGDLLVLIIVVLIGQGYNRRTAMFHLQRNIFKHHKAEFPSAITANRPPLES
jgi:hypothetical protein